MHKPDSATAKASEYTLHPEGQFAARCVDVINLGLTVIKPFKPSDNEYTAEKVALVFFCGQYDVATGDATGRMLTVSNQFTLTMSAKGRLRPFLEAWRGQKYTEDEARKGIAIEKLFGHAGAITVSHESVGDKTYANIISISKLHPKLAGDISTMDEIPYERDEYWEKKKATTREETEAWYAKQRNETVATKTDARGTMTKTQSKANAQSGFEEFPAGDDGDDDLPF